MEIWGSFVNVLAVVLFWLAQAYGGNFGLAIITVSFVIRLALLPLSVKIGRRMQARQQLMKELQPKIDRLKSRYRDQPERLSRETMKLYRPHGIGMFDGWGLLVNLAQLPIFIAIFSAIKSGLGVGGRFLWIGDIAQPDVILALIVGALTYLSSLLSANSPQQTRLLANLLPVAITLFFVWRLAAGIGLYWAASTSVGIIQAVLVRRAKPR
jgi:YidC/Oxa1 family membrane protein insertase